MSIPLNTLIDNESNVYEVNCLAIKEADIYSSNDMREDIEKKGEKVVSVVLTRALNNEIEYTEGEN